MQQEMRADPTGNSDPLQRLVGHPGVSSVNDVLQLEAAWGDPLAGISSTYGLLERGASRNGPAPAFSFFLHADDFSQPFTWSHQEWFGRITQTANLLRRLGIGRRDTVAFVLPNLPETHWVIWGGEAAGAVFAINPLLEPGMLRELMDRVQPKLLVTLAPTPGWDLWEKVASVAPQVKSLQTVLTVSPLRYQRAGTPTLVRTPDLGPLPVLDLHEQLRDVPESALAFPAPGLEDVASYFCTGGTTGTPKIAVRTHRTEVANASQLAAMFGNGGLPGPIFCGLPLFHVNAQIGTGLMPWALGGHVVLGTPSGYRSPGVVPRFWEIAEHFRLFSFSGVPTVYAALLQAPRQDRDLSSLRYGICGAAPMPFELVKRFQADTGIKILEGYGLTEGGCVSTLNPPAGESRPGSVGIRLPWQEVKVFVLDAEGRAARQAATGEVGAIAIRGPNLFKGYLNPEHNRGLWIEPPEQRWLNTGDLGRVDDDGYLWLTGRSKELIIRGGHNIDPKLIEEPLHEHPAVALVAAVGRPDAHAGEVPVAYIQLRPDKEARPEELLAWAQERIAERAAWPRQVILLPALPMTAVGKIFKPALIDREILDVVREEARLSGVQLAECEVVRDPALGLVVRWSAPGGAQPLRERLAHYTFRQEAA
jgi:acyl-CoA synthetase (AMP-forming)/AMP-acid ligase II